MTGYIIETTHGATPGKWGYVDWECSLHAARENIAERVAYLRWDEFDRECDRAIFLARGADIGEIIEYDEMYWRILEEN